MQLAIGLLREADGRWIAGIPELPDVAVYGGTPAQAELRAKALALRVIAEELEHGEILPAADILQFSVAA
jgi:predicted RNase H-like HicB family nuclease